MVELKRNENLRIYSCIDDNFINYEYVYFVILLFALIIKRFVKEKSVMKWKISNSKKLKLKKLHI